MSIELTEEEIQQLEKTKSSPCSVGEILLDCLEDVEEVDKNRVNEYLVDLLQEDINTIECLLNGSLQLTEQLYSKFEDNGLGGALLKIQAKYNYWHEFVKPKLLNK